MIRAIIFDFDGLILDTEGPIYQSWQELFQEYGCRLSLSDWAKFIGTMEDTYDPFDDLEGQLGQPLDRRSLEPRRRQRELDLIANQAVLPGVEEHLRAARRLGLKIGLASSSSCDWVTGHLERLDLRHYFDCLKASDDVRRTKPDPELYQAVLAEFDLRPSEALVFEDSPNGVLAARRAGLFTVAVPNPLTRQLDLGEPDLVLSSLAEISLEELLGRARVT